MPPKVHPAHPAGLKQVRKRTLNQLATTPQQTPAPLAPDPTPVPIHRIPSLRRVLPAPPAPVRLRNIAPNPAAGSTIVSLLW